MTLARYTQVLNQSRSGKEPSPVTAEPQETSELSELLPDLINELDVPPTPDFGQSTVEPRGSRLISRVLAPAMRLWLRSQLDHVEDLELVIQAGDRQLLSGVVPRVTASAQNAIYQGLHFCQVAVAGQDIRTNFGQVLRGKPFRLLAAFPVNGTVALSEPGLNASLRSPLLKPAAADFVRGLLQAELELLSDVIPGVSPTPELDDIQATIGEDQITLQTGLITEKTTVPITIRMSLRIDATTNSLVLENPLWLPAPRASRGLPLESLHGHTIPLGSDVVVEQLCLSPGQLSCSGRITVNP